jgi:ATP-binding cassette subfamily B protein RaxB
LPAFLAYKGQFVEKAIAFIEKGIEFRMLGLHAERIGDIAMEEPEPLLTSPTDCGALKGGLSARNLGYRYAPMEPLVFSGFNLEVAPGECVVLAGPSGCGKTTLLKVLLGLLPASDGEVLAEGRRLVDLGNLWLDQVGVVMQEDSLFAGSIAENIAFGETSPDTPRVVLAAQLAAVHEDVLKLPMQYNTLVGDMGSSLSGGQKQRVLLARALYRQPRILFLDEASSHLDVGAEQRINANLKGLGVTRIVVAHRPETIASGDRVVWVNPQLG